jgi:hypothetical protein
MISTVTTSTVSTVTTAALAGSVALIGILVLLVLLVQKELFGTASGTRFKTLGKALNIGIIPLIIAFAAIAFTKIAAILR